MPRLRPPAGASRQRLGPRRARRAAGPRRGSGRTRTGSAGWKRQPLGGLRRIGHLAGQRLGQEARPVGVRHGADQRLAVRVQRQAPERQRRPGLDHQRRGTSPRPRRRRGARSPGRARSGAARGRGRATGRRAGSRAAPAPTRRATRAARRARSPTDSRRARARSRSAGAGRRRTRAGNRRCGARGQSDELEQLRARVARDHARPTSSAVRELRADLAPRVERRVRVLEDELQPDELRRPRAPRERRDRVRPRSAPMPPVERHEPDRRAGEASTCRSRTRRRARRSGRLDRQARAGDRAHATAAAPLVVDDDVGRARARSSPRTGRRDRRAAGRRRRRAAARRAGRLSRR